jgi:hypothetical protein
VWDEGKYPTMSPLKEIVGSIQSQVAKIEDDMKVCSHVLVLLHSSAPLCLSFFVSCPGLPQFVAGVAMSIH